MAYPIIRLRNLGPIREGEIQLHPLTVLIGKNNTGKTYASQAVYSVFKAVDQVNGVPEPLLSDEEVEQVIAADRRSVADDGWTVFGSFVKEKTERWLGDLMGQADEHLALIIHGATWGAGLSGVCSGFGGGVCSGFGLVGVPGVWTGPVRGFRVSGGVFGLGAACRVG